MKTRLKLGLSVLVAMFSANTFAAEKAKTANAEPTPVVQNAPATAQKQPDMLNSANLVNINTATAAEIQDKLVGIGAKKAQAIVEYRTKNGSFSSLEQLTDVSGIGKATLDKNRDRIVLQ
ncbi:ComEA family DNA-binding protein [Actinobacillus vicugnae]|uniref:ComEA family DNA-binding protein n=1 Tax=Actinobacillus vicugnae TaxID=2573093 RepID=UPI001242053C|nr:helix-hairpin-helix domain-containing protein [Actinobacillus vicugnae]